MNATFQRPRSRFEAGLEGDPIARALARLAHLHAPTVRVLLTTRAAQPIPLQARWSAKSKLARLKLDSPTARQWVAQHEGEVAWNSIHTAAELREAAANRFRTRAKEANYLITRPPADPAVQAELDALCTLAETNAEAAASLRAFEAESAEYWGEVLAPVNEQRLQQVRVWRAYLTEENEEYAKDPFWQDCAWDVLHAALTEPRQFGWGTPLPLHRGALAELRANLEHTQQPCALGKTYQRLLAKAARQEVAPLVQAGATRTWVYLPSKPEDSAGFEANVRKLQALSPATWCTRTFNAEPYLAAGGFWLLLEGARAVLGLRLVGQAIREIQGIENNHTVPVELGPDLEQFLAGHPALQQREVWRARNPSTPAAVLAELVQAQEAEARRWVALHPATPPAALLTLASDAELMVRQAVAQHPNLPAAGLAQLGEDEDRLVLTSVLQHPNTPLATLERGMTGDNFVLRKLAERVGLPAHLLARLARNPSKLVRSGVAGNPSTPPAILEQLAMDSYYGVRGDTARNPNTPVAVLLRLLDDEHPFVRGGAAEHPMIPQLVCSKTPQAVEAYYDPVADQLVFFVDQLGSLARAAAVFWHELTHYRLARLSRKPGGAAARRALLAAAAPTLLAEQARLLAGSGYRSIAELSQAYGFKPGAAGRFALLEELLARRSENKPQGGSEVVCI